MAVSAYDLTGRTAFVTGAASGIGRASAVLLAQAGATVHCADRDEMGLHGTASLVKDAGGTAHTHPLDVTDRERLRRAVASCGHLDILAAVAGIMHSSPVLETRDEDLDRVLDVNFKGVLYACQEAARLMIARGTRGSIVTMASGAVDTGGAIGVGLVSAATSWTGLPEIGVIPPVSGPPPLLSVIVIGMTSLDFDDVRQLAGMTTSAAMRTA